MAELGALRRAQLLMLLERRRKREGEHAEQAQGDQRHQLAAHRPVLEARAQQASGAQAFGRSVGRGHARRSLAAGRGDVAVGAASLRRAVARWGVAARCPAPPRVVAAPTGAAGAASQGQRRPAGREPRRAVNGRLPRPARPARAARGAARRRRPSRRRGRRRGSARPCRRRGWSPPEMPSSRWIVRLEALDDDLLLAEQLVDHEAEVAAAPRSRPRPRARGSASSIAPVDAEQPVEVDEADVVAAQPCTSPPSG